MEEKKTPNNKPQKKETLGTKMKNVQAEFKKIIWPNKKELGKKTVTVIFVSALMAVIITALDAVYSVLHRTILGLFGE